VNFEQLAAEAARRKSGGVDFTALAAEAARRKAAPAVPPEMVYNPDTGQYVDTEALAAQMPRGSGAAASYLAGTPFVGEWTDEAMGYLAGRTPAEREIVTKQARAVRNQFQEDNPKTATALEVSSGILGSVPLALSGVGIASKAATTSGRLSRGAALGGGAGALEGASQGGGRAQRREDRSREAARGAVIGGSLGAALGAVSPALGNQVKKIVQRVKKLDVKTIADEFDLSPRAARIVRQALINDDLDAAAAQLARGGDDAMLADAGPSTQNLLDSAAQTGGAALSATREAVEGRAEQSGVRLTKRLDDILGDAGGIKSAGREVAQRTSAARQAAYARAYSQPIDYASDAGRKVEEVLSRVPPRTLNKAVQEANEAMIAEGFSNAQIMAEIAEDGSVAFREMPNVQQIDFIKRALGEVARGETDSFGRLTGAGIRSQKLASQLRDALGEAVPAYNGAVKLGGDKIAEDQALDLGRRILSRGTTFEDALEVMRGASSEAKAAARRGMREQIEETLSNVRRTITDPNVDAREAMHLVKDMSSRANMKKARLILGTDAKALFDELEKAEAALSLRAAVSRNSATAIRQSTKAQIADEVQPGLLRRTLGRGGNPLDAAQEITQSLAGIDAASMTADQQKLMAEIAQTLIGMRGRKARQALTAVKNAMRGQPLKDQQAETIGRLVAASTAVGAHQSLMQPPPTAALR
jgi:hypothetical protein